MINRIELRRLQKLGQSKIGLASKPLGPVTGYCVKCRAKRDMVNPRLVRLKNDKLATQGTCPVCGTKMFKIRGKS